MNMIHILKQDQNYSLISNTIAQHIFLLNFKGELLRAIVFINNGGTQATSSCYDFSDCLTEEEEQEKELAQANFESEKSMVRLYLLHQNVESKKALM